MDALSFQLYSTSIQWAQGVLNLLEISLICLAFLVTTNTSVKQAIALYKVQCVVLTLVTTLTALGKVRDASLTQEVVILVLLIALLPILLFFTIRPLLHRATLPMQEMPVTEDVKVVLAGVIGPALLRTSWQRYQELVRNTESEWLNRQKMTRGLGTILMFPILLLVALLVPSALLTDSSQLYQRVGLAVSLALHLMGLYNMIIKPDIVSQVIGLLIMDQGLYLAVVKIVEIPVPATLFVLSLYFYTLITIFILVILLPQMRAKTRSIDLNTIADESDLKSS